MGALSTPSLRVIQFQKAMVFVDGTNLFYRLEAAKLRLRSLAAMCKHFAQGRQLTRVYLYTSQPHLEKASQRHGKAIEEDVRVVLGDAIPTGDGNYKEKGVDALLVADLVYHAAARNYDYALLVSVDQDFARALKRVEDFGCRTGVIGVCAPVPDALRKSADDVFEATATVLTSNSWASG